MKTKFDAINCKRKTKLLIRSIRDENNDLLTYDDVLNELINFYDIYYKLRDKQTGDKEG